MNSPRTPPRIAVIGHVEHVTIVGVPALPGPGEILHVDESRSAPGGGGGIAYYQLVHSPAELHLFTALGNDEAAAVVSEHIHASGGRVHAARRAVPHTRDIVIVTPDGERSILVLGEPLHPRREDPLPWELLAGCRAVYFTAQDPELLRAARAAELLVLTARRRNALIRSGVQADVVVGSAADPREISKLPDYAVPPKALVMTQGADGGEIEMPSGRKRFRAPRTARPEGGYGAGDSFAGALTWYLACGLSVEDACARASAHGAAALGGLNPLDHQLPLTWPD